MKNLSFAPAPPQAVTKEEIIVAGQTVGTVALTTIGSSFKYHACINLPGWHSLIQGYGETREAATLDAIKTGKDNAHRLLSEIEALEGRLS